MICKRCSIFRKKRVVLVRDRPLQVRQATDAIQLAQRFQRVAGAQLGQVAAVEQLEELDDELDVADAAAAGFYVAGPAADAEGLLSRSAV